MTKNIIIYDYKHFGIDDISEVFVDKGYRIHKISGQLSDVRCDKEFEQRLTKMIEEVKPEFIFTFNYYPLISNVAKEYELLYISWVYDSPLVTLYSYTIINSCNRVFLFDYKMYEELRAAGIGTVFYLPLAVNTKRMDRLIQSKRRTEFNCDVSFVGSLYNEKKHSLYDRLYDGLDDYMKGYLDALVRVNFDLYGIDMLQQVINDENIIKGLQKSIFVDRNYDGVESPAYSYAEYFVARKITELERTRIMEIIPKEYKVNLYTHNAEYKVRGINNCGMIDYYDDMPFVFRNSKINLNITLKSIKTGIPLRVFDIMGAGGFLLTNYQIEMSEYFEPGKDYVVYESIKDIPELIHYYMKNEDERKKIADNGYKKVKEYHGFTNRIEDMFKMIN